MQWSIHRKVEKQRARLAKRRKWHKHFCMLPVRIRETVYWGETVYKRNVYDSTWEFATLVDILAMENDNKGMNDSSSHGVSAVMAGNGGVR